MTVHKHLGIQTGCGELPQDVNVCPFDAPSRVISRTLHQDRLHEDPQQDKAVTEDKIDTLAYNFDYIMVIWLYFEIFLSLSCRIKAVKY